MPPTIDAPRQGASQLFSSPKKRTVILSLLLILATLAVYNSVVHNGFINLDDTLYLTGNHQVQMGLRWSTVKYAFTTYYQANWHPLTWLSFALDWQLFGKVAGGHHYESVLFHAFDAVLLFWLLQGATGSTWRSLMVAALFALHPANVESVAWASERKNVLSMMFFLLAMLAYGRYARQPSIRRYSLVALLFVLGLMAKPQIITLPCVLLLWDYWPLRRLGSAGDPAGTLPRTSLRWLVIEKLPLFALAGIDALITMLAQRDGGALRDMNEYSAYARVGNSIASYARYVSHAFWPFHLSPSYGHPGDNLPMWQVVVSACFLIAATAAVIVLRKKRYLVVGWFWFVGTMFPMIGLIQVGDQGMAERYTHIPFIGLFWIAVWGIADMAEDWRVPKKWLAVPATACLLTASFLTFRLVSYWHDSEKLWSYALTINSNDFMAHMNLGRILVTEHRPEEAIAEVSIAIKLHHYPVREILRFTDYELRYGHAADAAERCREALKQTQDPFMRAVAWTNIGVADLLLDKAPEAKENFENAIQTYPRMSGGVVGLGLVALKTGDYANAIDSFSKALRIEPTDVGYFMLAVALEKSGRPAEAKAAYDEAQRKATDMKDVIELAHQLVPEASIARN